MENTNIQDRDALKQQRKLRKEMKKMQLREQKAKERENAILLKLRPSDQHINIIKRNLLLEQSKDTTSKQINLNECIHEFPTLDSAKIRNSPRKKCNINEAEPSTSSSNTNLQNMVKCKKSKTPISIDIVEMLNPSKSQNSIKQIITKPALENNILSGNVLDSDNPKRKRGKRKEIPTKHLSKLKKQINLEKSKENINYSYQFEIRSYCDNKISTELNIAVENLLRSVVNFQQRLLTQEPQKILQKRRFVVGFHEIAKLIVVNKIKVIIIAPNLQDFDALKEKVEQFKYLAKTHNVYYVFALSRRVLGRIVQRTVPVSCVGILNYSGAEEVYQQMVELLLQCRKEYEAEHSESAVDFNDPVEKLIGIVTEKLTVEENHE